MNALLMENSNADMSTLLDPSIRYLLRRVFDGASTFNYILSVRLPDGRRAVVNLSAEVGRKLAKHWKQNEYGTFLGTHDMNWIVRTLTSGE